MHLPKHIGDPGIPWEGPGLAELVCSDERVSGVSNLDPVAVADDLDRAGDAVVAMGQGIDEGLADHGLGDLRAILALGSPGLKHEGPRQVIDDRLISAPEREQQRVANLDGFVPMVRIRNPVRPRYPDVVDSELWKHPPDQES